MRFQIPLSKNATFSASSLDQQVLPLTQKQMDSFKLMLALKAKEMQVGSTVLKIK